MYFGAGTSIGLRRALFEQRCDICGLREWNPHYISVNRDIKRSAGSVLLERGRVSVHHARRTALIRRIYLWASWRLTGLELMRLLVALPVVLLVRASLWLMPSTRVHAVLTKGRPGKGGLSPNRVAELSRAVSRASRIVPQATCLTQALALLSLLRWHGEPSRVEIGFLRGDDDEVRGHAWLVNREQVVIGAKGSAGFTRTLTLEG